MAEIKLKKKITLRRKEEQADFSFNEKFKVRMLWSTATDLDLCLFFCKKDGSIGGIFSNEYRGKKSDLGNLNAFPFMLHLGDNKEPSSGNEEVEQINVANLDEIDEAHICVINYGAAIEGEDVTFAEHHARVELTSDTGDNLEVLVDSNESGHIYNVCSITNRDGKNSLKKVSEVLDLSSAFEKIPGFSLICNE